MAGITAYDIQTPTSSRLHLDARRLKLAPVNYPSPERVAPRFAVP